VDDYLGMPGFQYVKGISMWLWLEPDEMQPTVQSGKALYLIDARGTGGTVTLATGLASASILTLYIDGEPAPTVALFRVPRSRWAHVHADVEVSVKYTPCDISFSAESRQARKWLWGSCGELAEVPR